MLEPISIGQDGYSQAVAEPPESDLGRKFNGLTYRNLLVIIV